MAWHVNLTIKAKKNLTKVPEYIKEKLLLWVDSVERIGINKTRTILGYHDEPLKRRASWSTFNKIK
ncbi:MAG: hypothetical protein QM652_05135 [Legionella sp.]|uniref:hypothetical protein n=1 Tax=Legionella sp. TaxID=459 RepID=UPI0039E22654